MEEGKERETNLKLEDVEDWSKRLSLDHRSIVSQISDQCWLNIVTRSIDTLHNVHVQSHDKQRHQR